MFRLSEALRSHRQQRAHARALTAVASGVAVLSPRPRPGITGRVATVAGVAHNLDDESEIAALLDTLNAQGAQLGELGQALWLRPSDWAQVSAVSRHWPALRARLDQAHREHDHGPDRPA